MAFATLDALNHVSPAAAPTFSAQPFDAVIALDLE
jgi:hypothetical protein